MHEHQNPHPWTSSYPPDLTGLADVAAPAAHPAPWLTACSACREWVDGVYHVMADGQRLCRACTPPAFLPADPNAPKKPPYVGPRAPAGSSCRCNRTAVAECQTCLDTFCTPCWWRHSHARSGDAVAARTHSRQAGGDEHEH